MTKRILIPLPDADFDTTEVAVPWKLFTEAGHSVVFATERGGAAPRTDSKLLTGVIFGQLGAEREAKDFYGELEESVAFQNPIAWHEIDPGSFDALVLPGGHAPGMKQYLASPTLQAKVAAFAALERPIGAICHGVLVLARSKGADGKSVLSGFRTTCLPKYMERTAYFLTAWKHGKYYRTYPEYVEDEVTRVLSSSAQFVRGPFTLTAKGTRTDDTAAFVVDDRNYVSARWPGDAYLFAKSMLAKL